MRIARPALCLALVGSLTAVGAASAATKPKPKPVKPVCNLVVDPTADAAVYPGGGTDDTMDITSVDVATDKQNITAVLRVKKLSATTQNAPTGLTWAVSFTAGGIVFTMAGHGSATGATSFDTAYATTAGGSLYGPGTTGAFDTTKNEVRISAPLSLLSAQADIKPGTKITAISGLTGQEVLVPDATGAFGGGAIFSTSNPFWNVDDTPAGKDYTAGALSCVKPGK